MRATSIGASRAERKASRLWWHIHHWTGLKLSVFMSFILFTGTLAVFGHEIDWLLRPAMRVDPASVAGETNWTAIADRLATDYPGALVTRLDAPIDPWFAASATLEREGGNNVFVYAHPTTGTLQGEGSWVGAQRILRNTHRHLNLPTKIGVPIVSALSILLAVSLVSAFFVYKKWWRGFFRPIRLKDARTALGDVHRLAGLWSLWFVALMALTGLWYLIEALGGEAPPIGRAKAPPVALDTPSLAPRLAASLSSAHAAFPALRVETILFPSDKSGVFLFQGQHEAILVRPRANAVWTEASTGDVLLVKRAEELPLHTRISEMADPLHFGTFGGIWTKSLWFVFGLMMTGLSLTGVAIYSARLARAARTPLIWKEGAVAVWRGMGLWRWPALAAVLVGLALLVPLLAEG